MGTGKSLGNLEQLDGRRRTARPSTRRTSTSGASPSRRDSDRFYATLATGGKTYLIEGSVAGRTATVIHENVECPSLSPDGTRVAYKKLMPGGVGQWRFHVLDLATMTETPLAETRAARRPGRVARRRHACCTASTRRSGRSRPTAPATPQRWLAEATSPAVVRR